SIPVPATWTFSESGSAIGKMIGWLNYMGSLTHFVSRIRNDSNMMKRARSPFASIALVGVLLAVLGIQMAVAHQHVDQGDALLPPVRTETGEETDNLDAYRLNVTLDPVTSTIGGSERITVVNTFGEPLERIALRVYPNAMYYNEASTTIESFEIDG